MKIEAIIFDMDGVLTDSMKYHIASWEYAFNEFNIFPTDEELALREGMSYRETIDNISQKHSVELSDTEKERIHSIKKERISEIFQYEKYPDVMAVLDLLKNNKIRLALVSGANREFVDDIISNLFPDFFEVIIAGDDVEKGKPDPESFLKALEKLDCDPRNVLVIENAPLGIESAKKAGLETYALTTTLNEVFLEGADRIFHSHKELLEDLKKYVIVNK